MLYVKADWNDQIPEINEENNVDSDDVTVRIDTLIIRVSDIFYSVDVDSDPGTFPDMTDYVTVTEQNYYTISGMADPAYWDKALEYHEVDPTIPQNKDVMPGIKIEEIADTSITVIFAVDFTSEMNQSPWIVPSVMDSLITIFKSGDQGGAVGFRSSDNILQTLTEDPGLIDNAFNQVIPDYPRLIYDGLSRGISVAREQPGRNVILAVVAGEDEGSTKTMNMVFRESRKYGVPIYILHIHQNTPSDSLRVLADQSGGFYFGISDASGFYQKIEILNRIFRNFYQLQHVSSDTVQNETWRILELALAYNNTITGQDRGLYLAPNGPADVSIAKAAESKSMELIQGQMEWVVHSNDTVSYTITLQNMGHWDVYDIIIEDVLESNLVLLDNYDLEPDSQVGHTVRWVIDTLAFADTYQFSYHCSVETLFVQGPVPLVNKADLTAAQDDDSTNNTVSKTVYYIPPPPGNLVVTKKVVSIGNVPVESTTDTMWVDPLGMVAYQVTLFNEGGLPCRNIVVKDELPKELRVIDFTGTVDTTYDSNTNLLSWTLNKLDSHIEKTFVYTCKEVTGGSPFIKALVNHVEGECDIDSNPDNNADSETVFLSRINIPDPEVSVSGHYGSPDDFVSQITIEPGDSVWIRIMTPIIVDSLALRIVFEDAVPPYEVDNYIDLNSIQLEAATPKILLPSFGDTEKRNDSEETQKVNVIFNTVSYWGPERLRDPRSDTAFVYIQSVDQFFLDRNTYKPGSEDPLQLEFMLSSNREVEIIIYDIAGGFVQRVAGPADGDYRAGWNFVNWNGTDKNNRMVGSGVYVAILMSGGFQKARKFIVIR